MNHTAVASSKWKSVRANRAEGKAFWKINHNIFNSIDNVRELIEDFAVHYHSLLPLLLLVIVRTARQRNYSRVWSTVVYAFYVKHFVLHTFACCRYPTNIVCYIAYYIVYILSIRNILACHNYCTCKIWKLIWIHLSLIIAEFYGTIRIDIAILSLSSACYKLQHPSTLWLKGINSWKTLKTTPVLLLQHDSARFCAAEATNENYGKTVVRTATTRSSSSSSHFRYHCTQHKMAGN